MSLRKSLIWLRKQYNTNLKKFYMYSIPATLLLILLNITVDTYLEFNTVYNIVRTVLVVPTAALFFAQGYLISLYYHYRKMDAETPWTPYRARFSPAWRQRISLIIGAILIVSIYATGFTPAYTTFSAFIVALIIALFAFMRTTNSEQRREEYNIPDSRDLRYEARKKEIELAREIAEKEEKERKKNRSKTSKR